MQINAQKKSYISVTVQSSVGCGADSPKKEKKGGVFGEEKGGVKLDRFSCWASTLPLISYTHIWRRPRLRPKARIDRILENRTRFMFM